MAYEIEYLKEIFVEYVELVQSQFEKSILILKENNIELIHEVLRNEKRVDSGELTVEKNCENILALFQPVATELRLVTAILKSVSDLERIGDHAKNIAQLAESRLGNPIQSSLIEQYNVVGLAKKVSEMAEILIEAFEESNSVKASKVFKLDYEINKEYRKILTNLKSDIKENIKFSDDYFDLFHIVVRIERAGNLFSNFAEEIIFYINAENLKHKKKKKEKIIKGKK